MRKINIHKIFDLLYEEDATKSYTMEDVNEKLISMGYTTDEIIESSIGLKVKFHVDENDQAVGGAEIISEEEYYEEEDFENTEKLAVCRNCLKDIPFDEPHFVVIESKYDDPENDLGDWCGDCYNKIFKSERDGGVA